MKKLLTALAAATMIATPVVAADRPSDNRQERLREHRENVREHRQRVRQQRARQYYRSPVIVHRHYHRPPVVRYYYQPRSYYPQGYYYRPQPYRYGYYGPRGYWGTVYRDDRGIYRCTRSDGTLGVLIGAGTGAIIGDAVTSGTEGAILGAVLGAIVGRQIDRGNVTCR